MGIRHLLAVGAAGVAAALGITTAASAVTGSGIAAAPDSLRALAAKTGLRIGTAVIPFDLDHPAYQAIAASQISGVANGTIGNAQLKDLLHQHIVTEVSRYKGRIWQWDVANEFFTDSNPSTINPNDFWISHLGTGIIADAFRWAHQADPHALLFYNDYNIAGEDGTNAKSDAVFAWLKQLLAQGVPINGIGDQGHLDTQYGFSGAQMTQDLQRYASLGLKVAITESDVRTFVNNATDQVPTDHLATFAQPDEFGQMLKACLAVRQCISFTVWGFGDADSWVPGFFTGEGYATIYDVNLNPKPAYTELQQDLRLAAFGAPHRVPSGAGL